MLLRADAMIVAPLLLASAIVRADGIAVAPIRLDIAAGNHAAVLTVTNEGDRPIDMQVRVMRWEQVGGEDMHTAATYVVVSPPRFTAIAQHRQIVRVYVRDPGIGAVERAYRLFLDQLPDPASAQPGVVQLPVRMLLPLFVAGDAAASPQLHWSAHLASDSVELTVSNTGGKHVRITSLGLQPETGDATRSASTQLLAYILPDAKKQLRISRPAWLGMDIHTVLLNGDSDAGPLHERLSLSDGD